MRCILTELRPDVRSQCTVRLILSWETCDRLIHADNCGDLATYIHYPGAEHLLKIADQQACGSPIIWQRNLVEWEKNCI